MRHTSTLITCLIALLAVAAAANGGAVDTTTTADEAVSVTDERVAPDATTTSAVTLSGAPNGLSGYNVTVRVADPSVATITDASVPERFGLSEIRIVDDGAAVVLKAADTSDDVGPGDTEIPLGTVTVRGESVGETELGVEVTQVDDDDGSRLRPTTSAGTLTVADSATTTTATTTPSTTQTTPPETTPPETTTATTTPSTTQTTVPETTTATTPSTTQTTPPETTTATTRGDATSSTAPGTTTETATTQPSGPGDETQTTDPDPTSVPTEDRSVPGLGGVAALVAMTLLIAVLRRR